MPGEGLQTTPATAPGAMSGERPQTTSTIAPGAMLGVMGGGQLARMFAQAAQQMGYAVAVLDPDDDSPAGAVAQHHIRTGYADRLGLDELARLSAAVTTEFENVPASSLAALAATGPVAPAAAAVAVCQDRVLEKARFGHSQVACAPHAVIETAAQLAAVPSGLLPGILKTARLGYDGKGQVVVDTPAALAAAWDALGGVACVLEQRMRLAHEISVIVARGADGNMVELPVQQNLHRDGILAVTRVPPPDVPLALQRDAVESARRLASELGYVGVLCVEFFVLGDGSLVANEMAPRPHNSGHHSIDACDVSQFELQVRTLAGLPLAPLRLHSPCVMLNLLGDLWLSVDATHPSPGEAAAQAEPDWPAVLALPGVHLHLYGKTVPRSGRKMGHLTVTAETAAQAEVVALEAARRLGLPLW